MTTVSVEKLRKLIQDETKPETSYFEDGWNNALRRVLQAMESGALTPPAPVRGLLPCPFCGKPAKLENCVMDCVIRCTDTDCHTRMAERHDPHNDHIAIEAVTNRWNFRPNTPSQPAGGWMPIETADILPRDGSHFLVIDMLNHGRPLVVVYFDSDFMECDNGTWIEIESYTHFSIIAPLPKPPEGK